jgi:hypothetical protein
MPQVLDGVSEFDNRVDFTIGVSIDGDVIYQFGVCIT